jgi:hypothetical protein
VVVTAALLVTGWSFGQAMTYPGSAPWTDRSVEWVRAHGGNGLVDRIEQWVYARHRPSATASADDPVVARAVPTLPARHDPAVGRWRPAGRRIGRRHADPAYPSVTAGAARMDHRLLRATLVPGTAVPGGGGWAWGSHVPSQQLGRLVAAFNSGFRFRDTHGGFLAEHREAVPLEEGWAALVIRADGSATVSAWSNKLRSDPTVVAVRQSLKLIVADGHPAARLTRDTSGGFGTRRQQLQYTWRSGLGIDRRGDLVYVGGKDLTLETLADALVEAGVVTGMQLDIHDNKVTFNLFDPDRRSADGVRARKLLSNMQRPATRYLEPDQRDFIAMTLR